MTILNINVPKKGNFHLLLYQKFICNQNILHITKKDKLFVAKSSKFFTFLFKNHFIRIRFKYIVYYVARKVRHFGVKVYKIHLKW